MPSRRRSGVSDIGFGRARFRLHLCVMPDKGAFAGRLIGAARCVFRTVSRARPAENESGTCKRLKGLTLFGRKGSRFPPPALFAW